MRSLTTPPLAENLPMRSAREAAQPCGSQEMRLRLALDGAGIGVWAWDIATGELDWNAACYRHFGVPVDEKITHDRLLALLEPGDRMRLAVAWRQAVISRDRFQVDCRRTWPDGSRHWIQAVGRIEFDAASQPVQVNGITRDVTRQKQAELDNRALTAGLEARIQDRTAALAAEIALRRQQEQHLRLSEALAQQQLAAMQADYDQAPVGLFVLDAELRFQRINAHLARLHGQPAAAHLGRTFRDLMPGLADQLEPLFHHLLQTGEPLLHHEIRGTLADAASGRRVWRGHYHPRRNKAGAIVGLTGMVEEGTALEQAQERAEYLAYHDALTGLPNRVRGVERLANQVALAQRQQRQLAVLYLDLDQFKHINDRWGHEGGDRLLQDLGRRLTRQVRAEDSLCRLAGDEFMLVLPDVGQEQSLADLASLCERLLALLAEPYDLDGQPVQVNLSLGVALYPRDGTDGETLMRHADTALNAAKRAGRQTYRFFEPRMNEALSRFIQTRDALRLALARQEFVLHYQPRIELLSGRVVGVEALVRWQRPGVGLVMPDDFIDVAEESGLIVPLGSWVLREACRQAAAWRVHGWPDLVMAVNLSAVQYRRGGIGAEVLAALEASGLDPTGLELELTESILLACADEILATVSTWKAAGIQLAIDDFGTGYSSLAYLKCFPVDKLKIDRSFIAGMAEHAPDRAIVQAILDLARALKLRSVAEGVEDAVLARELQVMGCDEAQGYLYARPLAVADLERWRREWGMGASA